jgi:hypothetical protein
MHMALVMMGGTVQLAVFILFGWLRGDNAAAITAWRLSRG